MDIFNLVDVGATLSLVGLCYKMANDKNGKYITHDKLSDILKSTISKEVCDLKHQENKIAVDSARNIMETKILSLTNDVIETKSDVKEMRLDVKELLKESKK